MEEIITRLLVSDSAVIQQATEDLKRAFRSPSALRDLCTVCSTSNDAKIRQYAAVLLRQRVTKRKNWNKLDAEFRSGFTQEMLTALQAENEQPVVKALSQLLATVAKHDLVLNNIQNLLEFVGNLCTLNPGEDHSQKARSYFILCVLSEECPEIFASILPNIGSLVVDVMRSQIDVNNPVLWHCLSILKNLSAHYYEDKTPSSSLHHLQSWNYVHTKRYIKTCYSEIIPQMLQTVNILAESNEIMTCDLLEMFDDMVASATVTAFQLVLMILESCLRLAVSKTNNDQVIVKALTVVDSIVKLKKKALIKHNLIKTIVDNLVEVMQRPSEEVDYDTSNEYNCPVIQASQVLDTLFLNFAPSKVMPIVLEIVRTFGAAENPHERKTYYLVMAVSAEGCSEYIRINCLKMYLEILCNGLEDPEPLVRNAALYALGQFSEHLQPEFGKNTDQLMPVVFRFLEYVTVNLKDLQGKIHLDRVFYAIETFTEHLEKEKVLPYLSSAIANLVSLVQAEESSTHLKQLALSAIAACASSSEENITPYFQQIVECLSVYLVTEIPVASTCLQVQALETMATLARSVPPETFEPVAQRCIQYGFLMLNGECDPEVESSIYGLFGAISVVLKENMSEVMGPVITIMMKTIQSNEGILVQFDDEIVSGFPSCGDLSDTPEEVDLEAASEEDDEDEDEIVYSVENIYVDNKISALFAIKEFAANTGVAFYPYLHVCFPPILQLLDYRNDAVKKAAIDSITKVCISMYASVTSDEERSAFENNISVVYQNCAEIVHTCNDREVVCQALDAYAEFLKCFKNFTLKEVFHRDTIFNCVLDVFHKRTYSQLEEEDDDEENVHPSPDEEKAEKEELLFEYAGDIVPYFGRAMTCDEFRPYFASFFPLLKHMLKRAQSPSVHSFSIGILAECMEPLGPYLDDYAQDILPEFISATKSKDGEVRNNAVFGIGELLFYGKEALFGHYSNVLQLMSECLTRETVPKVIDNICGAVSRMIVVNPALIPIPQVFPVIMSCLPLRVDFKENHAILKCFMTLYECGHDIIALNLERIIRVIIHIVHHKQGEEDSLILAKHMFHCIQRDFPEIVSALSVPDEMRQTYSILLIN